MMARQYALFVMLVGCLSGELAHGQRGSCKPANTGLLIRSTEQDTAGLNEINLSVMWRADNDSGCEYRVELGTCRGSMPDFYCGETVSSTSATFPSANCSVRCQELIVAVTASRDCVDCVSYFYLNGTLNDTLVHCVDARRSINVSLPSNYCDSEVLTSLCIGGQYNDCYDNDNLSSLPEHHQIDCQNQILRISEVPESLNGTLYTVVIADFIQCIETRVSTVIFNFQLVVNAGSGGDSDDGSNPGEIVGIVLAAIVVSVVLTVCAMLLKRASG